MALHQSELRPAGELRLHVVRGGAEERRPGRLMRQAAKPNGVTVPEVLRDLLPRPGLGREINGWRFRNMWRVLPSVARLFLLNRFGGIALVPRLYLKVTKGDGRVLDLGLASMKVVTTAGVNYLVDALQNSVEPENFKYHGYGTGGAAEAVGNTALTTELTTEYVTDSTRPTGSQTEGASANIYRTVGTLAPDSGGTLAITEHGIFSADAAGTLLDRSLFSAVNLVAGADSLQTTYDLTLAAGG